MKVDRIDIASIVLTEHDMRKLIGDCHGIPLDEIGSVTFRLVSKNGETKSFTFDDCNIEGSAQIPHGPDTMRAKRESIREGARRAGRLTLTSVLLVLLTMGAAYAQEGWSDVPPLSEYGRQALRFCESTDDYTTVHTETLSDGSTQDVYGAYQFVNATWQAALQAMDDNHGHGYEGRTDWFETWGHVLPSDAPPSVQDTVVTFWWNWTDPVSQFGCYQAAVDAMTQQVEVKFAG